MEAPAPCRTLYVRNLPEKLKKLRLRRLLHAAFSPHGRIVHIVAEKSLSLRGQAFITFYHQAAATAALRHMHAVQFMGKPITVAYARSVSDRAASPKLGGSDSLSRKRRAEERSLKPPSNIPHRSHQVVAAQEAENIHSNHTNQRNNENQHQQTTNAIPLTTTTPSHTPASLPLPLPPNNILFVQNLPPASTSDTDHSSVADLLNQLFSRFSGFVEVRMVPGNSQIAFVEFSTDAESAVALGGLQAHPIGDPPHPMRLSFAKK